MALKKNDKNSFSEFLKEGIKSKIYQPYLGWSLVFLSILLIISIFSKTGFLTTKINNFLNKNFGWSIFSLPVFLTIIGFYLITKNSWSKVIRSFIGFLLIFLILSFYFHWLFREGGSFGSIIFKITQYIGLGGSLVFSLITLMFSLWLISEEKFIAILKSLYSSSQEKIRERVKKINNLQPQVPLKQVKVKINNNYNSSPEKISKPKEKKMFLKSIWKLPPLDLLTQSKEEVIAPDIKTTSQTIQKTLENFGLKVEIVNVEVGPAITRFLIKPGEGVKLSKVLSYQSDLALSLGVPNLIIETPVPDMAVLGIQVPNKKTAVVKLGNLLRDKNFSESYNSLIFPLGRKINGEVLFADLTTMTHLLIAGATGSGKSIFIHSLLISLLMKNTPENLNLVLIDPKRVELNIYQDLPHLILEPIVEIKKSLGVFNWIIEEMEERYKILQETKSRDIDSYNKKQIQLNEKLMPKIVVIIDEMADLMMTYGSSLEVMILRLAQMARATGIHLVLATQRPSVEIVTGLIKANIPNRVCFKVASYVDSRTVLDTGGAEKLTGAGDGLFISTNLPRPVRIKAPYVAEAEVEQVIDFWCQQAENVPNFEKQTIPLEDLEKKPLIIDEEKEDEELYNQAIKIVLETGRASTSLLQRRLKIGYARAARLLDLMEKNGIVGPQEGSKPRKILIDKDIFPS